MFDSNKSLIYFALKGWINHIETDNFSGMSKDTILQLASGDRDMQRVASELPRITHEQQIIIDKINKLAEAVLNGDEIKL